MSFTKTISAFAALASIFGVSVAGYKLAESSANTPSPILEEKIIQLEIGRASCRERVCLYV